MNQPARTQQSPSVVSSTPPNKPWVRYLESVTGKPTVYTATPKSVGVVYLLVDCSGSMAERDKIGQARRGAIGFAHQANEKGYAVGVIRFDSSAELVVSAQCSIRELETCVDRVTARGSTNLAGAIRLAGQHLQDAAGERVMCVVTDGFPDDASAVLLAADEAKARGMDIMALGTDDADSEFLARIVTRLELQVRTSPSSMQENLVAMVKLLPAPSGMH